MPLRIGVQIPSLDDRFDRLAVFVVADLEQRQLAFAFDRLLIERVGLEVGLDCIAHAIVAAIDPGEDLERLAGDQHLAGADDRAARFIDHFGRDRVLMVLVAMNLLGDGGVDLDFTVPSAPISTSRSATTSGGSGCGRRHHQGDRPHAAPIVPAGIPIVVVGEPPIAAAVEPVPTAQRIPRARCSWCAVTLYFTLALVTGEPK